MSVIYLETSAVLSWLFGEPSSSWIKPLIDSADEVYTSDLTIVEAQRGLIQAEHKHQITANERLQLTQLLAEQADGWFLIELSENILKRAAEPFPAEPVRTLDGLHLATALSIFTNPNQLRVLSLDNRICRNAHKFGFLETRRGRIGLDDRRQKNMPWLEKERRLVQRRTG